MDIVIEFWSGKSLGVECNWVQLAIWCGNRKDSGESIVGSVCFDCNLGVRNPMGKDRSCSESLFKCFKGSTALIRKVPGGTLVGKTRKWNCDFGISVNEMMVEVGETKEGLNILDFLRFGPILDNLDLVWGHGEAFGGQHVSKVFAGSDAKLAFVCTGKKTISVESSEYFLNMSFVLGNVVGIDEDVIQVDDDYDINHICEDVVHK